MIYLDMFQAPFDSNTFDNLPLPEPTPSTHSDRLPKGLLKHSFTLHDNMNMCHKNLATLFTKLDKHLKGDDVTLVVDSYSSLVEGLDTDKPELDLMEFVNSLPGKHVFMVNRDLTDSLSLDFLRGLKQSYDYVISVDKNAAGYSRDVHGQLNVS